jgi:predicted amidohydrolase
MHIFAVQFDIVWEDKAANYAKVRRLLSKATPSPDSLIVLPEMFATGFSLNLGVTQQNSSREDECFLAQLAQEHRACVVGGVVAPGSNQMGRNDAAVFGPDGRLLSRYTKIHPFTLGGEGERHEVGKRVITFEWGGFIVAPFVCYDLRFPEVFRAASRAGANLFTVIALWPNKRQQHWLTLLQARAIENQAFVVGVNRVGIEPNLVYAGRSVVVDPHGVIVADAGEQERVLATSIDVAEATAWRGYFPALLDAHFTS